MLPQLDQRVQLALILRPRRSRPDPGEDGHDDMYGNGGHDVPHRERRRGQPRKASLSAASAFSAPGKPE